MTLLALLDTQLENNASVHGLRITYPNLNYTLHDRIVFQLDGLSVIQRQSVYILKDTVLNTEISISGARNTVLDNAHHASAVMTFPIWACRKPEEDNGYVILWTQENNINLFAWNLDNQGRLENFWRPEDAHRQSFFDRLKDFHPVYFLRSLLLAPKNFNHREISHALDRFNGIHDPYGEMETLALRLPKVERAPTSASNALYVSDVAKLLGRQFQKNTRPLYNNLSFDGKASDALGTLYPGDIHKLVKSLTWLAAGTDHQNDVEMVDWGKIKFRFVDFQTYTSRFHYPHRKIDRAAVLVIDLHKAQLSEVWFADMTKALSRRTLISLLFILKIFQGAPSTIFEYAQKTGQAKHGRFLAVALDTSDSFTGPHAGFNQKRGADSGVMIPDLYYLRDQGYSRSIGKFNRHDLPFETKKPMAFWRGSTTGRNHNESIEDFLSLPRTQLARLSVQRPDLLDAKLTKITQATEGVIQEFSEYCKVERLTSGSATYDTYAQYRYIVDMDGNANSWGLLERFLLGSCVLKAPSNFEQWFYPNMKADEHYVEIKNDLSDLFEKIEYLNSNPEYAAEIAHNGQAFAASYGFHDVCKKMVIDMLEFGNSMTDQQRNELVSVE